MDPGIMQRFFEHLDMEGATNNPIAPRPPAELRPQNPTAPPINYGAMSDAELAKARQRLKWDMHDHKWAEKAMMDATKRFRELDREFRRQRNNRLALRKEIERRENEGCIALVCPPTKTTALSKAKLNAPMEDVCAICADQHTVGETLTTSCKHQFGKACYAKWALLRKKDNRSITCPMCKAENPKIQDYRGRATKKPKTTVVDLTNV